MAKHLSADDDIANALALLSQIEHATGALLSAGPQRAASADGEGEAALETASLAVAGAGGLTGLLAAADAPGSPLVRLPRRFGEAVDRTIVQASDTGTPGFLEKLRRSLRPGGLPRDLRRRDPVLAARLAATLQPAGRLIAALRAHRPAMKAHREAIEASVSADLHRIKSWDKNGDAAASASALETIAQGQDVVDALIGHAAACNAILHKLEVDIERGFIVLHALTKPGDTTVIDRLGPSDAVFLEIAALWERGMLSMREADRRKRGVDDSFIRMFDGVQQPSGAGGDLLPAGASGDPDGQPTRQEQPA